MINNKVNEDGVFCQKHSKHSISSGMWCEEKKRLIEKNNAEESLRLWRRRKAEEFARKERDKKEVYFLITFKIFALNKFIYLFRTITAF